MRILYAVVSNEATIFPNGSDRNPLTLRSGGDIIASFLKREEAEEFATKYDGRVQERQMNEVDYKCWEDYLKSLTEPVKNYKIRVAFEVEIKERTANKAEDTFWLGVREDGNFLRRLVKDNLVVVKENNG